MKAKCIKADPLQVLRVGNIYDLKEYPFNFGVLDNGKQVFGISKDNFADHFELVNHCGECCWMIGEDFYGQGTCAKIFAELVNCSDTCHGDQFCSKDEMEKAVEVLEAHNKWRRDDNVPNSQPMVDPKELGKAIDLAVEFIKTFMEL